MSATSDVAGAPGVSRLFYHIPAYNIPEPLVQAQKNPPTGANGGGLIL